MDMVPGDSVCELLHGLLMQYRDCYLIPANDPPYADCILRLTSLDDEARRAVAGFKVPAEFGRSYSPQTFRRAEVTDALYRSATRRRRIARS